MTGGRIPPDGQRFAGQEASRVVCDDSKPLLAVADDLNLWANQPREEFTFPRSKIAEAVGGKPAFFGSFTRPSLSEPVRFASSAEEPGLQIADIIATGRAVPLGFGGSR